MASRAVGAVGVATVGPHKGVKGFPISAWHLGLAWLDILTDVVGIFSTRHLSNNVMEVCGVNLQGYFYICFLVQCCLLGGNVLTHIVLAAIHEARFNFAGYRSVCARAAAVVVAMGRALLQGELAYHELRRSKGGPPTHTAASLHYRMAELVWEAPQIIINWLCLIISIAFAQMAAIQGIQLRSKVFLVPVQLLVLSAVAGLVSLTLAAQEFMMLHPRSAWARSQMPARLFLGLLDVGDTWWLGIVSGVYAFLSLFNKTAFYTLVIHNFGAWSFLGKDNEDAHPGAWRISVLISAGCVVLNLLVLLGLGLCATMPAAAVNLFINIPWASGRTANQRVRKYSAWRGWLLQLIYGAVLVGMFVYIGGLGHSPDSAAKEACGRNPVWDLADSYDQLTMIVPICTTILEVVLFVFVSGYQHHRKAQYMQKHGDSHPAQMAKDLKLAYGWPASCIYRFKGLIAYRIDHHTHSGAIEQRVDADKSVTKQDQQVGVEVGSLRSTYGTPDKARQHGEYAIV